MKYNKNNKPLVCMQTTSACYRNTRKMGVKGVLWHSTGANNPMLNRYVQPSDDASDRVYWLHVLGKNQYNNDWNHTNRQAGMNCWIGKLADGSVTTVQTMPWNYRPWGCGRGNNGSCNDGWIQFEICEDNMLNEDYFNKVYKEACEITAYICSMFNLDPRGYTSLNGIKVPVILCHADSHTLGLGGNHGDIYIWFEKYGKDMDDVRNDVAALMNLADSEHETIVDDAGSSEPTVNPEIKAGDIVKIAEDATYYSGKIIPAWVKGKLWIVSSAKGDRAVIDKSADGKSSIRSPINAKHLTVISEEDSSDSDAEQESIAYRVKVDVSALNIRKGPGIGYDKTGVIEDNGVYTIVDEAEGEGATKWGKLKSGVGWISLDYVKKI